MKNKLYILTLIATLAIFSACSSEPEMTYADLGSEEYPQKFYMEYVPCTYGENWSVENFNSDMLPEWQDLLVETNSTLVAAYGITFEGDKPEDAPGDGFWQLVWNSKADAEAGWETWEGYDKTTEWAESTADILACGSKADTFSFDAYVRRAGNSLGEFDLNSFSSDYQQCLYNEGQGASELIAVIDQFEEWIEASDSSIYAPYGYVILAPDYEDEEVDLFWGNFNQNAELREAGNSYFAETGSDIQDAFNEVLTCEAPVNYNSGEIPLT